MIMAWHRWLAVAVAMLLAGAVMVMAPSAALRHADGASMPPNRACGTVVLPPGVGLGTSPNSITSLSPFFEASDYDAEALNLLYYNLIWVTRHQTIDWSRSMARSIVVAQNDTKFTVTMKPWRWSDGQSVTAGDVAYTFDRIKTIGSQYVAYGVGGMPTLIKRFTVINPEKFEIITTRPVNPEWFEFRGLVQLIPYPAHAWSKYNIDQLYRRQSDPAFFKVVDGAYEIEHYRMGRYISFVPNPRYQGHKSQIKRLVLEFLHSSGAEIEGMQSGGLDMSNVPFSLWKTATTIPGVRVVTLSPVYGFQFIQLNFRNPAVRFFRDLRIRQAIADAIDQRREVALLYHGQSHVQHGPIPVDPPIFLSPAARANKYQINYDPALAERLLSAAGWRRGADGMRMKDGQPLTFKFFEPTGSATGALVDQMIQQDLRAVGIAMKIRRMTFNQMVALAEKPTQWDAMAFGWTLGGFPSDGAQFKTGGAYNQAGYSDKTMDSLLDDVDRIPGDAALYPYQDYAAQQQPVIFLAAPGSVVLVRNGLRGVRKFLNPIAAWSPQYLHWTTPPCGHQSISSSR